MLTPLPPRHWQRRKSGLFTPERFFINLKRYVEVPIKQKFGIAGLLSWELIDAKTGLVKRRAGPYPNLIVDAGLDRGFSNGDPINFLTTYCGVGTDSTAPSTSDTDLISPLGSRTNNKGGFSDSITAGPSSNYHSYVTTRVFEEAEVNGNLTEVAFFRFSTGSPMWMRQLFKDDLGSPTTITKTSDDLLKIIYEFRTYPNQTISTQSAFDISGTATDIDSRAHDIDGQGWDNPDGCFAGAASTTSTGSGAIAAYESNTMPGLTTPQSGSSDAAAGKTPQSYVSGSFELATEVEWSLSEANFASGVGSIVYGFSGSSAGTSHERTHISTFDPHIDKDDTKKLIIQYVLGVSRATIDELAH